MTWASSAEPGGSGPCRQQRISAASRRRDGGDPREGRPCCGGARGRRTGGAAFTLLGRHHFKRKHVLGNPTPCSLLLTRASVRTVGSATLEDMPCKASVLSNGSHRLQLAEAKDRKARKAAQQTVSQAKGRLGKYEERLKELAATPGVPKVEVGSLEEVCALPKRVMGCLHDFCSLALCHVRLRVA